MLADPGCGLARMVFVTVGRLEAALSATREPVRLARGHVAGLWGGDCHGALAGHPTMRA